MARYRIGQRVVCTDGSFAHVPPDQRVGIVTRDDGAPHVWVAWFCLEAGNAYGLAMTCKREALAPAPIDALTEGGLFDDAVRDR